METIEYPFVDTYYFGQDSLTLRRNVRMEAVKQRMQADPALAQTFQAAFDQLELSIQSVQAKVCLSVSPISRNKYEVTPTHGVCHRAKPPSSRNMHSPL